MTELEALIQAQRILGRRARLVSRRARQFGHGRGPMLFEIFAGETMVAAGRSWWDAVARLRAETSARGDTDEPNEGR